MPTSDAWRPQAAKNVGLNPTFPSLNEEIYPEYEMGLRLNLTKTQLIEVPIWDIGNQAEPRFIHVVQV